MEFNSQPEEYSLFSPRCKRPVAIKEVDLGKFWWGGRKVQNSFKMRPVQDSISSVSSPLAGCGEVTEFDYREKYAKAPMSPLKQCQARPLDLKQRLLQFCGCSDYVF